MITFAYIRAHVHVLSVQLYNCTDVDHVLGCLIRGFPHCFINLSLIGPRSPEKLNPRIMGCLGFITSSSAYISLTCVYSVSKPRLIL